MEIVKGKITTFNDDGTVVIKSAVPSIDRAILRKYSEVEIGLSDGRKISAKQRRAIYVLLGAIADFVGDTVESQKEIMKLDFILNRLQCIQRKIFSLSDVDMTTAREFQSFLVDFIIENDIPMSVPLLSQCDDIGRYIYACSMARKCAVCGRNEAHIHHCEGSRIGKGNDRETVHHLGREVLPLCAVHHDEIHRDEAGFIERYHLQKIKLDEALCKRLKLKK
jgi:hypothetical protein